MGMASHFIDRVGASYLLVGSVERDGPQPFGITFTIYDRGH
jgi:hypothetical protein